MNMIEKIRSVLSGHRREFDFNESLNFIEEGMLDSFDIINLVTTLDSEFGISIDGMDVLPDNFSSVERIEALLKKNGVEV